MVQVKTDGSAHCCYSVATGSSTQQPAIPTRRVQRSYTQCPEGFEEFYNQRRRWYPSHMASTLDFIMDAKQTVKINDNISYLYIVYQVRLSVSRKRVIPQNL